MAQFDMYRISLSLAVSILMQQGFTTLAIQKVEAESGGTLLYSGAKVYRDQGNWFIGGYSFDEKDVKRYLGDDLSKFTKRRVS